MANETNLRLEALTKAIERLTLAFIKVRKVSVDFLRLFVVDSRGGDFIGKVSEMNLSAAEVDVSSPTRISLVPRNAFILGCLRFVLSAIKLILRRGTYPKILPPVVEMVSVYMVGMKTLWGVHYKTMKEYASTRLFVGPNVRGISSLIRTAVSKAPRQMFNFLPVGLVNKSNHSVTKFYLHSLIIRYGQH